MRVKISRWARVGGLLVLLIGTGGCASRSPKSAVVPWDALQDSRFLEGTSQQTGNYAGTLVLMPCDLKQETKGSVQCQQGTRRPALLIPDDATIHPLIAGEPNVREQLSSPALIGKRVLVNGILYPELKAILVSDVRLDR